MIKTVCFGLIVFFFFFNIDLLRAQDIIIYYIINPRILINHFSRDRQMNPNEIVSTAGLS